MLSRTGLFLARATPIALGRAAAARATFNSSAVFASRSLTTVIPKSSPHVARRHYTRRAIDEPAKEVDFDAVSEALAKKDPNLVLVDVREPNEFAQGHIPSAVNIPFRSSPGALGLDPPEFEEAFGFAKPPTDKTLLFYCQGGVRCQGAEQLAATYGYQHRQNYSGSYQDWVDRNGETEMPQGSTEGGKSSNTAA